MEGENLPASLESLSEVSGEGRGVESRGWTDWGSVELSCSRAESSSTFKWKTAFFELGLRRGRAPKGANAPGPRSSENDERVRRCPGRGEVEELAVAEESVDVGEDVGVA